MFFKAFLIISIAAVSISGLPAGNELDIPINRDVVDDMGQLLYDIHEDLKAVVAIGKTHIAKYVGDLVELSQHALAEAKSELEQHVVSIYADLQKLKEKISTVDVETKQCALEKLYLVKELLEMAKADLLECINGRTAEGKEFAEKTIQSFNKSEQVIAGLLAEIEQCEDKACKVEAFRKIMQETANLEEKINKSNTEARELLQTLPGFQACLKEKVKGWRAGAVAVLEAVGECIRDKIEN